jgi:hypothetical protein
MNKKIYTLLLLASFITGTVRSIAQSEADFKEQPFPPTVELFSVLDRGFHMDLRDAHPSIGHPKVVFLPTKNTKGEPLFTGSLSAGDEVIIYGQIKDKSDKVVYKLALVPAGTEGPLTMLKKNPWHDVEVADEKSPWVAGEYTFEITVTGKVIFSMPFQIVVGKNDDPYAKDKEIRIVDGYWSKFACYQFDGSDIFTWNSWETNGNMKFKNSVEEDMHWIQERQLFYNGKPFTTVSKDEGSIHRGAWEQKHCTFHPITDKFEQQYLKSSDMKDGSYVMKVKTNSKEKDYPFSIKDGKPVYIAEQDKAKTPDLAKCLEGCNKTVWLKASN